MTTTPAIELHGLTKSFRQGRRPVLDRLTRRPDLRETVAAVDAVDLRIRPAEIFGLLGPNGAGKSTTVRMIATLLTPTAGTVRINGIDAVAQPTEARRRLGVVLGGERSVYWKLTGRDNLRYFGALHDIPRRQLPERIAQVLADVELTERADDYVERYSTGMRQRLAIARALLARPPVLLLDEPTSGLDPQSALHLRDHVRRLRAKGHTALLTTHDMEEAEQLCDRIAIIDHGRIVAMGTMAELRRRIGATRTARVEVRLAGPGDDVGFVQRVEQFSTVADKQFADSSLTLVLHAGDDVELLPQLAAAAAVDGGEIRRLEVDPVSLADVFLTVTGRELRE
jgi:ABC-2 type transport system ATP-binding protein